MPRGLMEICLWVEDTSSEIRHREGQSTPPITDHRVGLRVGLCLGGCLEYQLDRTRRKSQGREDGAEPRGGAKASVREACPGQQCGGSVNMGAGAPGRPSLLQTVSR